MTLNIVFIFKDLIRLGCNFFGIYYHFNSAKVFVLVIMNFSKYLYLNTKKVFLLVLMTLKVLVLKYFFTVHDPNPVLGGWGLISPYTARLDTAPFLINCL